MAERETREQAQERILEYQGGLIERLEKNPIYIELCKDWEDKLQMKAELDKHLIEMLTPRLFNPKYEIGKLLESIAVCKTIIRHMNKWAIENPSLSEDAAECIKFEKECIQNDIKEIQRIRKGDFEWLT